jgi:hypothetical protein
VRARRSLLDLDGVEPESSGTEMQQFTTHCDSKDRWHPMFLTTTTTRRRRKNKRRKKRKKKEIEVVVVVEVGGGRKRSV